MNALKEDGEGREIEDRKPDHAACTPLSDAELGEAVGRKSSAVTAIPTARAAL
jgi:hypothetical protein